MNSAAAYMSEDSVLKAKKGDLSSFVYLLKYARPWRATFLFGFALLLLATFFAMGAAYLLGVLVSSGITARERNAIVGFACAVVVCEALSVLLVFQGRRLLSFASSQTILQIRKTLFAHLHRLPLSYYDRQPLGRTVTRISFDVEGIEDFFSSSMARMVISSLMALGSMIAMLITNRSLGLITVVGMLPALFLTFATRTRARDLNREYSRRNSAINARLSEYLNGIHVIRNFGLEDWSKRHFEDVVESHLESSIQLNEYFSWVRPTLEFFCQIPLMCVLWYGGKGVLSGALEVGMLVSFLRYCDRFARPVSDLSREVHVIQQAFSSAERVTVFLKSTTEDEELGADGTRDAAAIRGEIKFEAVSMSYSEGPPVLNNLSFHIGEGQTIGFAGETGSGKTSTVSLLARLYEFQSGRILLDGVDIRSYSRDSLRAAIGFVSQDVVIFKGTLRENLDDSGAIPDDQITKACSETGLLGVLGKRGLHLNSMLLDKGANLSVGERQLIAITRVLLKAPRILVLDEATANIDPELEGIIHDAIDSLMIGKTSIIIAHRLGTLKSCNKLVVFRNGAIVEEGSHDALASKGGYYASLLKSNTYKAAP